MKKITCELCGSNEIIKKDGMYECQHCGTRYTAEEAQKLIGTVKIDRTDENKKYVKLMEYAYNSHDFASAVKYANLALEINPLDYYTYSRLVSSELFINYKEKTLEERIIVESDRLPGEFKTCLSIRRSTGDDSIEKVKVTIDFFVLLIKYLAEDLVKDYNSRISKCREDYRANIIQECEKGFKYINGVFERIEKSLIDCYGENHELVDYFKNKWLLFTTENCQYFMKNDAESIIQHIKGETEPANQQMKKDIKHQNGFFGLFK